MLPTIQDGEILHIQPVITGKLRIGHIVLLRRGEQFRAHRIIRRRGEFFVTRGDAGLQHDGFIPRGHILGLVIGKRCTITGRMVRLDTPGARLRFFADEARRRVAMLVGVSPSERMEEPRPESNL